MNKVYAIDTETTGLKHSHGHYAFAIGYGVLNSDPTVIYPGIEPLDDLLKLSNDPSIEWVGHNIGFDLPFLKDYGIELRGTLHDTLIASHVYNNLEEGKSLDVLATKYCGIGNTEDAALDKWFTDNKYKKDERKYEDVPFEIMNPYLQADIRRTLALFMFYRDKGVTDDPAYKAEMEVLPIITNIVTRGMCVDVAYAKQEFDKATKIMATIENEVLCEYGIENIASTAQIADALFTRGGLTCVTHTDKGNICLDEQALKKYTHPLIDKVLMHRDINKLTSTYLMAIIEKSHEGRLHSGLRQVGACTGRMSSNSPNLQNLPRTKKDSPVDIRKAFITEKNSLLLFVDLSQIELRILAHYSKEPRMISTLKAREGDLHKETAIAMFGESNKELRTIAKTLAFSVIYGAGKEQIARQLNQDLPGRNFTTTQTADFKYKFYKGYPQVQQLVWDIQKRVAERGYVQGMSGKKYYVDKKKSYVALNYLCQGESACLFKEGMLRVDKLISDKLSTLVNVVHDEYIFQINYKDTDLCYQIVKEIENDDRWRVPIFSGASFSLTNWSDKKDILYADLESGSWVRTILSSI